MILLKLVLVVQWNQNLDGRILRIKELRKFWSVYELIRMYFLDRFNYKIEFFRLFWKRLVNVICILRQEYYFFFFNYSLLKLGYFNFLDIFDVIIW